MIREVFNKLISIPQAFQKRNVEAFAVKADGPFFSFLVVLLVHRATRVVDRVGQNSQTFRFVIL